MTAIAGIVLKKRGVLLAADSQSSSDYVKRYDTDSKVFQLCPQMAIAYTGSGRFGQVMKHWVMDAMDEPPVDRDLRRWYVREFQPVIRDVLSDHGILSVLEEDTTEHLGGGSAFLLAVRDRLFAIETDFSINENERPFEALGSGGDTAIGALHAELGRLRLPKNKPADKSWEWAEELARRAITAPSETTPYVGGPVRFLRTEIYTADEKKHARKVGVNAPTPREEEGWYL